MNGRSRLAIVVLFLVPACATVDQQEFDRVVKSVRLLTGTAPRGCAEIGSFDANGGAMGASYAKDILRYKVGKAGGNLVVLEMGFATTNRMGTGYSVTGTGYRCKTRVERVPQSPRANSPH